MTEGKNADQLRFPDGMTVTLLERGHDRRGDYLRIEHRVARQGALNGPHWHPVLIESFLVKQGAMKGIVDGIERVLGAGESLTIRPKQVHQFFNVGQEPLIGIHEIRPPASHWEMFVLHHKLACEGKLNARGMPYNPLWLGMAWKYGDGYAAAAPAIVQRMLLGGLARLAKALGYRMHS